MSDKLIKCVEQTRTFTFGKVYESEGETDTCYVAMNNEGVKVKVLKSRFEIVRDEEMLSGKFVCVREFLPGRYTTKGKIYEIKDGEMFYDSGRKVAEVFKSIEDLNNKMASKFQPYKEYLTISELDWTPGMKYKMLLASGSKRIVSIKGNQIVNEKGANISDVVALESVINARYEEINPNQQRIDELENLIDVTRSEIQGTERKHKSLVMVLDSYIAERDELKG